MYCPKGVSTTDNNSQFAANVGEKCLNDQKYNTCFSKIQRDASNVKRKLHGAAPVIDDVVGGGTLQTKLADLTSTWNGGEIDLPNTDLALPAGCQDVFYKFDGANGASDTNFMTTPLAVNAWYGYSKYYDYIKGTTIYPKDAKNKK